MKLGDLKPTTSYFYAIQVYVLRRKCRGRLKELTVTEDPSQMSTSFNINDEMERMTLVSIRCLTGLEKYCVATSFGLVIELKEPLSAKPRNMQICLFQ